MPQPDSGIAQELVAALQPTPSAVVPEESRIAVHAAVSRFAVLYERIRNAVDYKDEHLLRKSAVLRILKRQLILERDANAISQHLVRELVGARYLPNAELPETLITDVALRVKKFQVIEHTHVGSAAHVAWLLRVVSVEIEGLLTDGSQERAFVTFLYERLADRIRLRESALSETDLKLQIYLACTRALVKADDDALSFKLLRVYLPEWLRADEWIESPLALAERLVGIERRIQFSLRHAYAPRIQRAVKPWAVSLNVLQQALLERPNDAASLLKNTVELHASVSRIAERQYREAKSKLRRGAFRATIYIFLTKMLIAFAVEVPVEKMLYSVVSFPILGANLLLPPFLMFIVALFIRVPGKDNTARIGTNVDILLSSEGVPLREMRIPNARGFFAKTLFGAAYAVTYLLIFGGIGWILFQFHFTWVSAAIFLFFLCTVSFFAFRLRQTAREYVIVEGRESLRSLLADVISLPILQSGHVIARGINRMNVFLFFFDFLLEAPFKIFLVVLEEWFAFLKEKKEEIQ